MTEVSIYNLTISHVLLSFTSEQSPALSFLSRTPRFLLDRGSPPHFFATVLIQFSSSSLFSFPLSLCSPIGAPFC